ncbi:MAG TPA: hypothetical protein VNQ74_15960, partial [Burkholderiaceae bacterium]|nr:hypothetical protein [Burkholderiaceae bacterium]
VELERFNDRSDLFHRRFRLVFAILERAACFAKAIGDWIPPVAAPEPKASYLILRRMWPRLAY